MNSFYLNNRNSICDDNGILHKIPIFYNDIEKEYNNFTVFPKNSNFIVTLGSRGTLYRDIIFPSAPVEVFDVCGAGDVFLSSLVYWYLKTNSIDKAIPKANKMAAISVSHMGTYVLTKEDING